MPERHATAPEEEVKQVNENTPPVKAITYGITCEIRPTPRQITFLQQNFGCTRKVYNLLVEEGNKRDAAAVEWHAEDPEGRKGEAYPYTWIPEAQYKEEHPYLRKADAHALQQARAAYFEARKRHFESGAGRPKFKSKWRGNRTYTAINDNYQDGPSEGYIRLWQTGNKWWLTVPKLPKKRVHDISEKTGRKLKRTHPEDDGIRIIVPARLRRLVAGGTIQIRRATLGYRPDGSYYASLHVTETLGRESEPTAKPVDNLAALCFGGDLGLKSYLVGTDGVSYDDPGDYEALEKRLHREERKLGKQRSRLQKRGLNLGSCKNYQRQRRKVARLRRRIANKREDFRHKLSRQLVDSYDLIVLEDLHVASMLRNHCLARGISEAAWADFVGKVSYKAEWTGKRVVLVDRWFPSTRTCSCCGAKTGPHGAGDLGVRFWVCPECGARHNRDENASWNILLEGLRIAASGEDEAATVWGRVRELVLARHKMSFGELVGRVAPALTDGTSGIAWVEDDGVGAPMPESDSNVYTERGCGVCLAGRGLSEFEVSRKSRNDQGSPDKTHISVGTAV